MSLLFVTGAIIVPKLLIANPKTAAIIATILIVIWSASLETTLGYGAVLMMTLPFCWVIYGVILAIYWFIARSLSRA